MSRDSNNNKPIPPSWQKILDAAAVVLDRYGDEEGAPRNQVMAFAGYTQQNKSAVASYLSGLKKRGFVTYDKDTVFLTPLGHDQAQEIDVNASNEEQISKSRDLLEGQKAKLLFDFLVDGSPRTREECAHHLDYAGPKVSAFCSLISKATKKGVMEYCKDENGNNCVRLADMVFPFGRPRP